MSMQVRHPNTTPTKLGEVLAIIPARGTSKGIPRKNLRLLAGQPLITHTIRHARTATCIQRVVVSTEDPEIAQVAQAAGAEVISRPQTLATDSASSEAAVLHALGYLEMKESYHPNWVVMLQCTSPLRTPWDLDQAMEQLISAEADSLLSACRSHTFLWQQSDGGWKAQNYDYRNRLPRQQCPIEFVENGSFYITRTELLKQNGNRLGGQISIYEMSTLDSFQLDTEDDWTLIEHLFRIRQREHAAMLLAHTQQLILDFDGVMTDNRVLVMEDGHEAVFCHRGDGLGIARLKAEGVAIAVISLESNPVVASRCRKLGITYYQGVTDKRELLHAVASQTNVPLTSMVYVGNDITDIPCMQAVGVGIAVADAIDEVKAVARLVTSVAGGLGAVREVCDWILEGRSIKPATAPTAPMKTPQEMLVR